MAEAWHGYLALYIYLRVHAKRETVVRVMAEDDKFITELQNLPLAAWSSDTMIGFLLLAWRLIEEARAFPPESDLPDWDDLRGRAPDATGDLSGEAFVRELRDGWR
jgi:hypothetical protein